MICAAISYMECQNEPSSPFLLELPDDVPSIRKSLAEAFLEYADEEGDVVITRSDESGYGDITVGTEEDSGMWLFVTLPDDKKGQLAAILAG